MSLTTTDALLPDAALDAFAAALTDAIAARYPDAPSASIGFEAPRRPEFGDFATNAAFSLAKTARRSPNDVAVQLVADLRERTPQVSVHFASIEPMAGFINLRLVSACWQALVATVIQNGDSYGVIPSTGKRVSLEFGSANPTGPMVVVQGRTLSIGDALARAMRYCGYDVFTEWLINDAGNQVEGLGRSLYARYRQQLDATFPFPEDAVYPGDYLVPLAEAIAQTDGAKWADVPDSEWLPYFAKNGLDRIVAGQQQIAERFGVRYDLWQSEKALHDSGAVVNDIAVLTERGFTYEADGAVFFKSTEFGDDKDRVLVRSDGRPTYFAPDVAYHYEKLRRADRVIDILGPDHHGYIERLKGFASALGYAGHLDVLIAQQITLLRNGEQVSMSKRAGNIITLEDIVDEVGVDAARFFFVMLATDSPLTFDLALAVERSSENPVFYVQYGHARIASVLKNAAAEDVAAARTGEHLARLEHAAEIALARRLYELPKMVRGVVEHLAPHRLTKYAREVANDFHQFYTECKILGDDRDLRIARLGLCIAAKSVLARALNLIGVSAPESM